jgi:transcriptional regulator with XRE-family HTH domain
MQNVDQKLLATRVKALRRISRFSQDEVALKLGITLYHFKAFEDGSKILSQEEIIKLSDIFHEDLSRIDSEVLLLGKNHQLTRVNVKRDNRYFINEFVKNFIKLDSSLQESLVQVIQGL